MFRKAIATVVDEQSGKKRRQYNHWKVHEVQVHVKHDSCITNINY